MKSRCYFYTYDLKNSRLNVSNIVWRKADTLSPNPSSNGDITTVCETFLNSIARWFINGCFITTAMNGQSYGLRKTSLNRSGQRILTHWSNAMQAEQDPGKLLKQTEAHLQAIQRSTEHAKRLYAAMGHRMAIERDGQLVELDPTSDETHLIQKPGTAHARQ